MTELIQIKELIKKKGIKPSDCSYHTWRDVKDKKGEITGKIRILVLKADGIARTEYLCPQCGYIGYEEIPWKRPFSVTCKKCGFVIKVSKLKQEAKKDAEKDGGVPADEADDEKI